MEMVIFIKKLDMKNKYHPLMTKSLANEVEEYYQFLLGKTFPVTLGISTMQVPIDRIFSHCIEENAYDVILQSAMNGVEFREIYMVLGLNKIRLFDYLEINDDVFPFERFGIGYCKLVDERMNGVDLYL
jgi:hypothetical protein